MSLAKSGDSENETNSIQLQRFCRSQMSFSTSLCSEHIGHMMLHLSGLNPPWRQDFEGKSYIIGSNLHHHRTRFRHQILVWLRKQSRIPGARIPGGDANHIDPYCQGTWKAENYTPYDGVTGAVLEAVKLADGTMQLAPINTKSLTEQVPLESRRARRSVAAAIEEGNFSKAISEKSKLKRRRSGPRGRSCRQESHGNRGISRGEMTNWPRSCLRALVGS